MVQSYSPGGSNMPSHLGTLAPPGEYGWTFELMLPSALLSPQPKRQIDRFSRFCTAHGRKSLYFTTGNHFPPKLPLLMEEFGPHLTDDSLGQSEPIIQMASQSVQLFSQGWPQSAPILYTGRPFPPKLSLPGPHLTWFLGPIREHNPNGILIGSAVFAGLTSMRDRPTDNATRSVTIDLILQHLAYSIFTSAPQIRFTILALYKLVCMYVHSTGDVV